MQYLTLGTFTCPFCGESHARSADRCPSTDRFLEPVRKMGGTVLDGKYAIREIIAEGGMGVIYRGENRAIGKAVAVKFLNPVNGHERESYERFLREARIAASIDHPGIVRVIDLGRNPDGLPFMVMELLDGADLASRISEASPMDVGEAAGIAEQALDALRAVHLAGIVHRDLKPENLFLARQPGGGSAVKILDFGVSRLITADHRIARITEAGKVYGTPHYLSPEQARGDIDADHRSDIYSMSVIMFEMLTGRTPFDSESAARLLVDILTAPPPNPLKLRPDMPPTLAGVLLCGMEKDPQDRFQTAEEMLKALRQARRARPIRLRPGARGSGKPVTSGAYRIIGPPEEIVVPTVPYCDLIKQTGAGSPAPMARFQPGPAMHHEQVRTSPVSRGRQDTPAHRPESTPNPDLGEPEED